MIQTVLALLVWYSAVFRAGFVLSRLFQIGVLLLEQAISLLQALDFVLQVLDVPQVLTLLKFGCGQSSLHQRYRVLSAFEGPVFDPALPTDFAVLILSGRRFAEAVVADQETATG